MEKQPPPFEATHPVTEDQILEARQTPTGAAVDASVAAGVAAYDGENGFDFSSIRVPKKTLPVKEDMILNEVASDVQGNAKESKAA